MNKETGIAKREQAGALATNVFEADADKGIQNIRPEDLALPFLKVLGQLSPEVNERNAKYVKGAKPGMIYNTVTNELYDGAEGVEVLPTGYRRQYVEWQDRGESSGAPVAIHEISAKIVGEAKRDKMNKDRLPNGNYLENTANHFVILLGESTSTALISMRSTQLKISRKWNSLMAGTKLIGSNGKPFTPPSYSHIYLLKTVQMSNDKGTWYGWDVSKVGPVKDTALYETAKQFASRVDKEGLKTKDEKVSFDSEI